MQAGSHLTPLSSRQVRHFCRWLTCPVAMYAYCTVFHCVHVSRHSLESALIVVNDYAQSSGAVHVPTAARDLLSAVFPLRHGLPLVSGELIIPCDRLLPTRAP